MLTKSEALAAFDNNGAALGRAIGVGRAAISKLPEVLPKAYEDRIRAAAQRKIRALERIAHHSEDQADVSRPRSCA